MNQLHTAKVLRRATFNHLYIGLYTISLLALFYHHTRSLVSAIGNQPWSLLTLSSLTILLSDIILGFSWACTQSFHVRPIRRHEFPQKVGPTTCDGFPELDVFVCTADPYKEPPMGTVNTVLSVMAYDYPMDKVSVYASDDGGSQLTLFAFMQAAKFACHWLPFCREYHVTDTCPEAYFSSTSSNKDLPPQAHQLKTMYEKMKTTVETTVDKGKIIDEYVDDQRMRDALDKWTPSFTRKDHPTIIQALLTSNEDNDVSGECLPNLIYVSREKCSTKPHHFKAGALNTLLRVSATMTNAPIILTLDCDTYSNDPQTVKRALCYFFDPALKPSLGYVQFPQIFRGLNNADIYFGEHKRLFQIHPLGMDGLLGPNYVGANCFFQRRAFFGGPALFLKPKPEELSPYYRVRQPIGSPEILKLAHQVASCDFEDSTEWGSKMGLRYGSLVEDYYTGYRLKCEGWRSIFSHPERPAFLGDSPTSLNDLLGQCKRWSIGLIEVLLSRSYSTLTFGVRNMGLLMGLAYSYYAIWPLLSIPLTFYAFIPQLALINGVSLFPKVTEPWFALYMFLFTGAYAKDLLDFILEKGTFKRWWNSQRMWMICGVSSFLFGAIEYFLGLLGIGVRGFSVTSKQPDNEVTKRYEKGMYEFGVDSPLFVPFTMASLLNLGSFLVGLIGMFTKGTPQIEGLVLQMLLSGFIVINSWPIYEAIVLRSDKGKMPSKTVLVSAFMVSLLCLVAHSVIL